jgi:hypothetical protein
MRILFAVAALAVSALSIGLDLRPAAPGSALCRLGLCRFDQVFAEIDRQGMSVAGVATLLNEDPSNPEVWCAYGEQLAAAKQDARAEAAFDQAVKLGPGMPPVLMRAANFDFTHGRTAHSIEMANRILRRTDAFDQILFSYLTASRIETTKLLGTAIPEEPRAAKAWLRWLRDRGSAQEVLETWAWMKQEKLTDQRSAVDTAWALWDRKSFRAAQDLWADWLGVRADGYLHPQRLANLNFQEEPSGSPFDWALTMPTGVREERKDGLELRFTGTANVDFGHVYQGTTVTPGRYRFSAEVSAEGLTTDQLPCFRICDAVNPRRMDVQSPPVQRNVERSWVTLDFTAPAGTEAILVQVRRQPSQRFDNKIEGTLHRYHTSLVRIAP